MITFVISLDSDGKPEHLPCVFNAQGLPIRVDEIRETYEDENIQFEVQQGQRAFTAQTFVGQGMILARILLEWATPNVSRTER